MQPKSHFFHLIQTGPHQGSYRWGNGSKERMGGDAIWTQVRSFRLRSSRPQGSSKWGKNSVAFTVWVCSRMSKDSQSKFWDCHGCVGHTMLHSQLPWSECWALQMSGKNVVKRCKHLTQSQVYVILYILPSRRAIFDKAADLLSGKYRFEMLAATMAGQVCTM